MNIGLISPKTCSWRCIWDGPGDGTSLMARDQAFYSAFDPERDQPLLRFYTWTRPTLSLGRFQTLSEPETARLQALEIPVVRRPTGGQAILHAGDLTYSLVLPASVLPGAVSASHARISAALARGLAQLGIAAELGTGNAAYRAHSHCFATVSPADLHLAAGKLVGSAQVRRRKAVLQQGMLYLQADQALLAAVFGAATPVCDLAGLLGTAPAVESVVAALKSGFAAEFELDWVR
ncbi:MAG: lipoate--protein ligase family protein [Candidatus Sericytochromatia bacterium]